MFTHAVAVGRSDAAIDVFRKIVEEVTALGRLASSGFGPAHRFAGRFALFADPLGQVAEELSQHQTRPMQSNANGTRLKVEDLCHFIRFQLLHVMENENDAKLGGQPKDGPLQQSLFFCFDGTSFGTGRRVLQQAFQFTVSGHQFIQGDLPGGMCIFAAHPPAAIPSDCVEPYGQSGRILNADEVPKASIEDFLHRIFCVFPMSANLHAERKYGVLQQLDGLFNFLRRFTA
jgi:hypothetical protein